MKTKEFKTTKGHFVVVEIPEEKFHIPRPGVEYFVPQDAWQLFDLPVGQWICIDLISNIAEKQADEVVRKDGRGVYRNYLTKVKLHTHAFSYKSAKVSLDTLFESIKVFWKNPLGTEMQHLSLASEIGDITYLSKEWQEAQQNVFDKSRTYLFKKV